MSDIARHFPERQTQNRNTLVLGLGGRAYLLKISANAGNVTWNAMTSAVQKDRDYLSISPKTSVLRF